MTMSGAENLNKVFNILQLVSGDSSVSNFFIMLFQ